MLVNRIEQHQINKGHPCFNLIDELCFKSKNIYNYANYVIRQEFINNKKSIKYNELARMIKHSEPFVDLGSQCSQSTLRVLDKAWKSFFKAVKDYSKNPSKYLGRPKLPKYKKKDGRFPLYVANNQFRIENGYIYFSWNILKPLNNTIKTSIIDKLIQVRFVPRNNVYIMEITYQVEIKDISSIEPNKVCGIDLGLNNFATLTNNVGVKPIVINGKILKSINQYYNKQLAHYKSILKKTNNKDWSNRLDSLSVKRFNKIKNYMHKASKQVIEYCTGLGLDTIIIGNNQGWKQESSLHKVTNQTFVQIPYEIFINMVKYKAENFGINVIVTEESYTSGTSFLDNELPCKEFYNKSRRIYRGLFVSNKGIKINSDVNGSYQIIKKVVPKAFVDGIEGVGLHPLVINI